MVDKPALRIREDGRPIFNKPYPECTLKELNEYRRLHKLWRKANRHIKDFRPERVTSKTLDLQTIEKDPAIQRYYTVVKNRPETLASYLTTPTTRHFVKTWTDLSSIQYE